ncbi:MAG: hypothetical protein EOP07_03615 [Proteobacteria bacterium]|nr:MAG: hypothetical protein EOP07_03615 [Pseudomonadota bacterium]
MTMFAKPNGLSLFLFVLGMSGSHLSCKTAPSTDSYYNRIKEPIDTKNKDDDPCPETATDCHPKRFIVADDGLQKIALVNVDDPSKDWDIAIPSTIWDMQLSGSNKLLVTTTEGIGGYYEIDIDKGVISNSFLNLGFVRSVQRLKNGNTLIAGENLGGAEGTVIVELDPSQAILPTKTMKFPKIKNSRVIRRTRDNTFLMGSTIDNQDDHVLMEMDEHGLEVKRFEIGKGPAHMGLRLPNGDTAVTSGRDLSLLIFDENAKLKKTIKLENQTGKTEIAPFQAGYFQILSNNHYVLTNWQGKNINSGRKGRQLVEYNAKGQQVWTWKQDPKRFSSIAAVIVLDNLDLTQIYDDSNGTLEPAE